MRTWLRSLKTGFESLCIGFILTVCSYAFLLIFFKMLWTLYCETQVCHNFRAGNAELFEAINDIMLGNMLLFSFSSSVLALKICLALAVASELLLVKRLFYDSRGLLGKMLLFGIPSTTAVTYCSGAPHLDVMFAFYFLPTVNLMGYCFKFIDRAVPFRA